MIQNSVLEQIFIQQQRKNLNQKENQKNIMNSQQQSSKQRLDKINVLKEKNIQSLMNLTSQNKLKQQCQSEKKNLQIMTKNIESMKQLEYRNNLQFQNQISILKKQMNKRNIGNKQIIVEKVKSQKSLTSIDIQKLSKNLKRNYNKNQFKYEKSERPQTTRDQKMNQNLFSFWQQDNQKSDTELSEKSLREFNDKLTKKKTIEKWKVAIPKQLEQMKNQFAKQILIINKEFDKFQETVTMMKMSIVQSFKSIYNQKYSEMKSLEQKINHFPNNNEIFKELHEYILNPVNIDSLQIKEYFKDLSKVIQQKQSQFYKNLTDFNTKSLISCQTPTNNFDEHKESDSFIFNSDQHSSIQFKLNYSNKVKNQNNIEQQYSPQFKNNKQKPIINKLDLNRIKTEQNLQTNNKSERILKTLDYQTEFENDPQIIIKNKGFLSHRENLQSKDDLIKEISINQDKFKNLILKIKQSQESNKFIYQI